MEAAMDDDDKIRTRAYFLYVSDPDRTTNRALDDWLQAEAEILACELINSAASSAGQTPSSICDQDTVWYAGETLNGLFADLKPRLRGRRRNSVLLNRVAEYQDYLTSTHEVSDDEAKRQGANSLHIYRLAMALGVLVGECVQLSSHSVRKELKDLFSENDIAFETTAFNIVSAGMIQKASGKKVTFITEGSQLSPDLYVESLAYVECKDLHTASRNGLAKGLHDNLSRASDQLATAMKIRPLLGTGVFIDVPQEYSLDCREWQVIRDALAREDGPTFVLVSRSGINCTSETVSYPVYLVLATKSEVPEELKTGLLRQLTRKSYRIGDKGFIESCHQSAEAGVIH